MPDRFPTYDADERLRAVREAGGDVVPLHGTPAPALPPHVVEAVARALGSASAAPHPRGLPELRERLAVVVAAASLNGARALEIAQDQQALLSIIVMTLGMIGFVLGLLLAALLLGFTGFGLVLALTGVGMAVTATAFRRPLLAT